MLSLVRNLAVRILARLERTFQARISCLEGQYITTHYRITPSDTSQDQNKQFFGSDERIQIIKMVCEGNTFAYHLMHVCVAVFS
jgi:hypothetical protein